MGRALGSLRYGLHPADTGWVSTVVELVIASTLMPAAGCALIWAWRLTQRISEARRKPPAAVPDGRLEADLRRLRAELMNTETMAGLTAKHHRVRAVRAAYLDALTTACQRFDVAAPQGGDRAPLAEIYRAEAALGQRGLRLRDTVS
jgi:hypothetical protein